MVAALPRGEEVIYTDEGKDGLLPVQGNQGEGWVEKVLVKNKCYALDQRPRACLEAFIGVLRSNKAEAILHETGSDH